MYLKGAGQLLITRSLHGSSPRGLYAAESIGHGHSQEVSRVNDGWTMTQGGKERGWRGWEEEVELGAFRLPAGVRRPKGGAAGQACGCRGSAARTPGHRPARPARTTRCWSLAAGDPAAGPGTETQRLLCARRSPAPRAWQGLQLPLPLPPRSDGRSQR